VHGVGEKTAAALIQTYGSLEELLADAAGDAPRPGPLKGKPALRSRLRDARDYVETMQRLVPINLDAPLEVWAGERDDAALKALADERGFRGPALRLLAALDSAGAA
jgi:5'-3' exonuclease